MLQSMGSQRVRHMTQPLNNMVCHQQVCWVMLSFIAPYFITSLVLSTKINFNKIINFRSSVVSLWLSQIPLGKKISGPFISLSYTSCVCTNFIEI